MVEGPDDAACSESMRFPAGVTACVEAVATAAAPVYAVGGVVRDAFLGIPIDDWDFATRARPDQLRRALTKIATPDVIPELGRVAVEVAGEEVVFTTFRVEGGYGPDRRPRQVRFVDEPGPDAARRDFTINAIYVDARSGRTVDPVGGRADLRARRLRVIGDPRARLAEDPLRILRAIRFEASRELRPTADTAAAMAEFAPLCAGLTPERRFDELHRALVEPHAAAAVLRLLDIGVLAQVLPPLSDRVHEVRSEGVPLLESLSSRDGAMSWACVLGDPEVACRALAELRAPRQLRRDVAELLALTPHIGGWSGAVWAARRRLLVEAGSRGADFASARERVLGRTAIADALDRDRERLAESPDLPLPTGEDVLAMGVRPGPEVGLILAAVRQRVEDEGLTDPAAVRAVLTAEVGRRIKSAGPGDR